MKDKMLLISLEIIQEDLKEGLKELTYLHQEITRYKETVWEALTNLVNEIEIFVALTKDSNSIDSVDFETSKKNILKYFDSLTKAEQEVINEYRWATSDREKLLDFDENVVAIKRKFDRCIINHEKYFKKDN